MKVITISWEYGAGGHSIGRKVAENLGIEIYDKDIIEETALAMGLSPDKVKADEEMITKGDSFIRAITPISFDYKDTIYNYEKEYILKVASQGPCVILRRCAGAILEEENIESLNVFLYADEVYREKRIGEILQIDDAALVARQVKKTDNFRDAYYNHYTGKHMGDVKNWHLSLDTGTLGYDKCAELICQAAKQSTDNE